MKKKKNPAAVALGRKGGIARAKRMTPAERSASASLAARAKYARIKRYRAS
jgi:hypothetical protein